MAAARLGSLALAALAVAACNQVAGTSGYAEHQPPMITGTTWRVDDVDGAGIIDRSLITLQFTEDSRIAGSAGCNRYFGSLVLDGGSFRVSDTGATRMACPEALMRQEDRFLKALLDARTWTLEDTVMRLFDESGAQRIRAVKDLGAAPGPQDTAEPDGR